MVWAKSLVEILNNIDESQIDSNFTIEFDGISNNILKYYWNQTIFFNLIQGPNLQKPPEIIQYTNELINLFFGVKESKQPIRYEKVDFNKVGLLDVYRQTIINISNSLRTNVCKN